MLLVVSAVFMGSASAVHDTGVFELDGNIVHNGTATYDWGNLFTAAGAQAVVPPTGALLSSTFLKDAATPDASYFSSNGAGVKDIDAIANWGCKTQSNPLAKDDLLNAYVAFTQIPAGAPDNAGHFVLYLGSERDSNNGTSFAGFWLFKNPVSCNQATGTFSGTHTDGDLLVVSDYTNGGSNQDVSLYQWKASTSSLVSVANGGVCGSATSDTMCAIANAATVGTQWAPGNTTAPAGSAFGLQSNTFVESGIDLTAALGGNVPCFTYFQAETRSSNQLTATLKDFSAGNFSNCAPPNVATQLKNAADNSNTSSVVVGSSVYDTATISGASGIPKGTLTYGLFSDSTCQTPATSPLFPGSSSTATVTLNADGTVPQSPTLTFTQAGATYYWQASYSGDVALGGRNLAAKSKCTDEPLTITKAPAAIVTTPSTASLVVGSGSFSDTAHVTGGYFPAAGTSPDGTVTFKLYGPFASAPGTGSCVDSGTGANLVLTSSNVGASATPAPTQTSAWYTSGTYTATQAGTYQWVANYNGNSNSTTAHSNCGDTSEQVIVQPATPPIASKILLSDSVKVSAVSGAGTPTGHVTFSLYGPFATAGAVACTGTPVAGSTQTVDPLPATGLATTPTAVAVAAPGIYAWRVSYTSTSGNYNSTSTTCTAEEATIAYQAPSPFTP